MFRENILQFSNKGMISFDENGESKFPKIISTTVYCNVALFLGILSKLAAYRAFGPLLLTSGIAWIGLVKVLLLYDANC